MTGPEHYHTAEQLLSGEDTGDWGKNEDILLAAQAHATLALAAATALRTTDLGEWMEVAGPAADRWTYDRPAPDEQDPPPVNGFAIGRQP